MHRKSKERKCDVYESATPKQYTEVYNLRQDKDELTVRILKRFSSPVGILLSYLAGSYLLSNVNLFRSSFLQFHTTLSADLASTKIGKIEKYILELEESINTTLNYSKVIQNRTTLVGFGLYRKKIAESTDPMDCFSNEAKLLDMVSSMNQQALTKESLHTLKRDYSYICFKLSRFHGDKDEFKKYYTAIKNITEIKTQYSKHKMHLFVETESHPNYALLTNESFSTIASLVNKSYVMSKKALLDQRTIQNEVNNSIKNKAVIEAFYTFHYLFMLTIALLGSFTRYKVIDPLIGKGYICYQDKINKTLTQFGADEIIKASALKVKNLKKIYKYTMILMTIGMLLALLDSMTKSINNKKQSPELHVLIFSILTNSISDLYYYYKLNKEEHKILKLKNAITHILMYLNEAVACTDSRWIADQYNSNTFVEFKFTAEENNHNIPPRIVNQIVHNIFLQHRVFLVLERNNNALTWSLDLFLNSKESLPNEKSIKINDSIQNKMNKTKLLIRNPAFEIPFFEKLARPRGIPYVRKVSQGSLKNHKRVVIHNHHQRNIVVPEEYKGTLMEMNNNNLLFIENPGATSSVTSQQVNSLLSDRGMVVARKHGQNGVKMLTDHSFWIKDPSTNKRITLEQNGTAQVVIDGKQQQVPKYQPINLIKK